MTPHEKLRSLPTITDFLKSRVTLENVDAIALSTSDNVAVRHLNQAREKPVQTIINSQHSAA